MEVQDPLLFLLAKAGFSVEVPSRRCIPRKTQKDPDKLKLWRSTKPYLNMDEDQHKQRSKEHVDCAGCMHPTSVGLLASDIIRSRLGGLTAPLITLLATVLM